MPVLSKIIELKKQEAEYIGYEDRPYDALLDGFEAGLTTAGLAPMFAGLRDKLSTIVDKIIKSGVEPDLGLVKCCYPVDEQAKLCKALTETILYDYDRGRMDVAPHPFTAGTLNDSRITVRYFDDDVRPSIFSALHEGGHALYEQGFIQEHYGTPMAQAVSLGVHESQSRMMENLVGRSRPFWEHWYPKLEKMFPKQLNGYNLDNWYAAINDVRPSLIRVEADEVTYNLHIILRFEMESELFSGELDIKDGPAAWNEKMQKYLQVEVPNDANGIMQDIHWSSGLFGYFPTYTLGNLYSAQFYHKAKQDMPDLEQNLAKGDVAPLLNWLRTNIHNKGRLYRAGELMEKVTGSQPSEEYFIDYLNKKFGELYGF